MWKLSRTVVPLGGVKRTRIFRSSFGGGLKNNEEFRIKNEELSKNNYKPLF